MTRPARAVPIASKQSRAPARLRVAAWGGLAALIIALLGKPAHAASVDAHVYAEDTAREIALLLAPGTVLRLGYPDDYYEMAVVEQMKAKGFSVVIGPDPGPSPVRFALTGGAHDGSMRVELTVGGEKMTRAYDAATGRAVGDWSRMAPPAPVQGTAIALDEPSQLYQLGRSVEARAPDRALLYYRWAADLGQTDAAVRTGLMLVAAGRSEDGLRYLGIAADAGNAQAQYVVGLAYLNGSGVAKREERGRALLAKAAQGGIAAARETLAMNAMHRPHVR